MAIYEVGWAFSPTKKILNYLGDPSLIIFIINCVHFFLFVAMQSGLSAEGGAVRLMSLTAKSRLMPTNQAEKETYQRKRNTLTV